MPPAKAKLSVTIAPDIVRDVDRAVHAKRWATRSAAIEAVLQAWVVHDRAHRRDEAIDAYYRGMTAEERADDARWANAAGAAFIAIARKEEKPTRARRASRRRGKTA